MPKTAKTVKVKTTKRQKVNTQYFQAQLAKTDMSQRDLAKALGRQPTVITHMLRGIRRIRLEDATEMARLFSVSLDEILEAAGIPQEGVKRKESVPIVGWIDGSSLIHVDGLRGEKKAPAPSWGASSKLKALRYQTNGSALEGMNSALVYFNEGSGPISIDDLGRLAIIELEGSSSFIGVLKRAGSGGFRKFDVYSSSGQPLKLEAAIKGVSPVVWIKL